MEYTILQINMLAFIWGAVGGLVARWMWRKEIKAGKQVLNGEKK